MKRQILWAGFHLAPLSLTLINKGSHADAYLMRLGQNQDTEENFIKMSQKRRKVTFIEHLLSARNYFRHLEIIFLIKIISFDLHEILISNTVPLSWIKEPTVERYVSRSNSNK